MTLAALATTVCDVALLRRSPTYGAYIRIENDAGPPRDLMKKSLSHNTDVIWLAAHDDSTRGTYGRR